MAKGLGGGCHLFLCGLGSVSTCVDIPEIILSPIPAGHASTVPSLATDNLGTLGGVFW